MRALPFTLAMLFMCATVGFALTPSAYAQNVIITGMDDYNFGTHVAGSGTKQQTQAFCVGKSAGNKNWNGTINGSGAGGAFTITDGAGNTIPFTVRRLPNPTYTAGVSNSANQADNNAPLDCNGTDNQDLRIEMTGANLDGVPAGTYTGYIDVTVSP
ncbi:MAG: hypothetical protein CMF62_09820 [Magnetococcales bacterium]|nr:hypothetical protein [Magnetococcales bacterium]